MNNYRKCYFKCFWLCVLSVNIMALGYQSTGAAAFEESNSVLMSRLEYSSEILDVQFQNRGLLYKGEEVTTYLKAIVRKLYPGHYEMLRVNVLLSSDILAFVLANGSIYVSVGLLAKAQNEAQIASVLSHEVAHYVSDHVLDRQQHRKDVASDVNFFGVKRSLESLSDFSVALEMEADEAGYYQLVNAGYDPTQAVEIFRILAEEVSASGDNQDSLYSSHPKLLDRIRHFSELSKGTTGFKGEVDYLKKTPEVIRRYLELAIEKYQFKNVLASIDELSRSDLGSPEIQFYLGEAYRQRNSNGDSKLAERAYVRATILDPTYAPPYFALGVLRMKQKEYASAKSMFEKFHDLSPNSLKNDYVEYYANIISRKGGQM